MNAKFFTLSYIILLNSSVSAIDVSLDFSDSTSTFFDTNTADGVTARAAVQAAADDLSNAITTSLSAINTYSASGTSGVTTTTLSSTLTYINPDTGVTESYTDPLATNEFRVFVGAQSLSTGILGQGGQGSATLSVMAQGIATELESATNIASANSSSIFLRDSFEQISISGNFNAPLEAINFTTSYAPTLGNLWFDNDGSSAFHLDHTTSVEAGKVDLYTVALHELLHTLGLGVSNNWNAQVSGTDWLGSEAIALHGTGTDLISSGGDHVAENIMSERISDGVLQEVVSDPDLVAGVRKELTQLDLAILRDIGFDTVPEPSSTLLFSLGSLALVLKRRR